MRGKPTRSFNSLKRTAHRHSLKRNGRRAAPPPALTNRALRYLKRNLRTIVRKTLSCGRGPSRFQCPRGSTVFKRSGSFKDAAGIRFVQGRRSSAGSFKVASDRFVASPLQILLTPNSQLLTPVPGAAAALGDLGGLVIFICDNLCQSVDKYLRFPPLPPVNPSYRRLRVFVVNTVVVSSCRCGKNSPSSWCRGVFVVNNRRPVAVFVVSSCRCGKSRRGTLRSLRSAFIPTRRDGSNPRRGLQSYPRHLRNPRSSPSSANSAAPRATPRVDSPKPDKPEPKDGYGILFT